MKPDMPALFRALIIDDEPIARTGIRRLLGEHAADIGVIGECGDGASAIEQIEATHPDLVFLDIQMPEIDGFGVLQALEEAERPLVIFVTAFDEFAMRAFQVHALDYLLKPVNAGLFRLAVDRARAVLHYHRTDTYRGQLEALLRDVAAQKRAPERFVIKSTGTIRIVRVDEIDYAEADGDYVRLVVADGKKHLMRKRMNELEAELDPACFVRIHRSVIVRLERIKELHPLTNGDHILTLANGTRLTVSRTYRNTLFAALGQRPL